MLFKLENSDLEIDTALEDDGSRWVQVWRDRELLYSTTDMNDAIEWVEENMEEELNDQSR